MIRALRRGALRVLAFFFSEKTNRWVAKVLSKKLATQVRSGATDKFLEILLRALEAAFILMPSFRKNLSGMKATYSFASDDGRVGASMDIADNKVKVHTKAKKEYTVRVSFSDGAALRNYLFSKNQDILDSLLNDTVEVDGNITYIYRLGFWVKDLEKRFGVL
jgi:hypothetical protein